MASAVPHSTAEARFRKRLAEVRTDLRADATTVLQLNLGRLCNQACRHCHVDASPTRTELMADEVLEAGLAVLAAHPQLATLDITAGAPEMHPRFRELVERARALGRTVVVRHNLTIQLEPGQADLPELFASRGVELICSLPHYLEDATERQRGAGVYQKSIRALRALNAVGYGCGGALKLTLVANPLGAFLPPRQEDFERDMRTQLSEAHGLSFDRLVIITNMPIGRFADWLRRADLYEEYLCKLDGAFNPRTLASVMCRFQLSVAHDGRLHDCDFNQMLGLGLSPRAPQTIFDFSLEALRGRAVVTGDHCLGCTAGYGSSCGGALV
jgi:radical SAM/Cys-rich protein